MLCRWVCLERRLYPYWRKRVHKRVEPVLWMCVLYTCSCVSAAETVYRSLPNETMQVQTLFWAPLDVWYCHVWEYPSMHKGDTNLEHPYNYTIVLDIIVPLLCIMTNKLWLIYIYYILPPWRLEWCSLSLTRLSFLKIKKKYLDANTKHDAHPQ